MLSVLTTKPALPGGKFSGGALVALARVRSDSKGSRFATVAFGGAGFAAGGFAGAFDGAALVACPALSAGALAFADGAAFAGAFDGAALVACPALSAGALAFADGAAFAGALALAGARTGALAGAAEGFVAGAGAVLVGACCAGDCPAACFNWSRTADGGTF